MSETWEDAILTVLATRPQSTWTLQQIYAEIDKRPIVTERHRKFWGSQPNFHHWVRSELARLKKNGDVVHVGRAQYALPRRRD